MSVAYQVCLEGVCDGLALVVVAAVFNGALLGSLAWMFDIGLLLFGHL